MENSDNPLTTPDNSPITPDAPLPEEAAPAPVPEEAKRPRGRPKGSKDAKPRIRRVPVIIEKEEEPPAAATRGAAKDPGRLPDRKLAVSFDPAQEPKEPPPPPPPPKKNPRTLHREHAQAIAVERRKLALAKQAHYEGLFDRTLSW